MTKHHGILRKVAVGFAGGIVIAVGLVLVPSPAPEGWLIVFGGIALLATEFSFAKKWLAWAKRQYAKWVAWFKKRSPEFKVTFNIVTTLVVLVTVGAIGFYIYTLAT